MNTHSLLFHWTSFERGLMLIVWIIKYTFLQHHNFFTGVTSVKFISNQFLVSKNSRGWFLHQIMRLIPLCKKDTYSLSFAYAPLQQRSNCNWSFFESTRILFTNSDRIVSVTSTDPSALPWSSFTCLANLSSYSDFNSSLSSTIFLKLAWGRRTLCRRP